MATSHTNDISIIGRDSQGRIVESLLHGELIGIVNLRIDYLNAAELADFFRVEEPKLSFADLKPLSLGVDLIHGSTVDSNITNIIEVNQNIPVYSKPSSITNWIIILLQLLYWINL